jgi:hypothetical protein
MIVGAWYEILNKGIETLISGLGDAWHLPVEVLNASETLGSYLGYVAWLFPVGTLISVMSMWFALEMLIFGFKAAVFVYGAIRGVNMSLGNRPTEIQPTWGGESYIGGRWGSYKR